MPLYIAGLGTALPEHSIEQKDAATIVESLCCDTGDQRRLLPALYRRTSVNRRHSVVLEASAGALDERQTFFGERRHSEDSGPTTATRMSRYAAEALPLAEHAALAAFDQAGLARSSVTHLVTVSCSGFAAPGIDLAVIRELGLRPDVARTHVGVMGCHGVLNALRVARAFADADSRARVLVCAVELCSLHQQYGWRPDQIVANALFADGAAAVVGTQGGPADDSAWRVVANGSTVIPQSEDLMGWRIRDHGFEMTLSPRVPELIHQHLRPWLEGWLAAHSLMIENVGSWAVHPGGPRILQACAEAAGFERSLLSDSQETLAEYGNMSSPTVLFILDRLRRRNAPRPCVVLAFGPGLAVEAALVR